MNNWASRSFRFNSLRMGQPADPNAKVEDPIQDAPFPAPNGATSTNVGYPILSPYTINEPAIGQGPYDNISSRPP